MNLGKNGLSPENKREIEILLLDHELIKLKVLNSCPLSIKECTNAVGRIKGLEVVQVIGKTLVLFSPHPDEPEIKLPAA